MGLESVAWFMGIPSTGNAGPCARVWGFVPAEDSPEWRPSRLHLLCRLGETHRKQTIVFLPLSWLMVVQAKLWWPRVNTQWMEPGLPWKNLFLFENCLNTIFRSPWLQRGKFGQKDQSYPFSKLDLLFLFTTTNINQLLLFIESLLCAGPCSKHFKYCFL